MSSKGVHYFLGAMFLTLMILGCVMAAHESEFLRIQRLYSEVAKALDESETAIILLDHNQIKGWNVGATRLFGVDKDAALNADISNFLVLSDSCKEAVKDRSPSTKASFCKIKTNPEKDNALIFLKPIPNKEDAYMLIIAAGVNNNLDYICD